ncbi:hypothetical protein GCM10022416_24660 [Actinomadura keratinilytica]|jgi:hypothetical protein|uniref:PE-PGRS family protein n=1 Tax=Actinomadura keratinilytica TaxID=547461 RepID=A0ABP7YNE2_9ACTN
MGDRTHGRGERHQTGGSDSEREPWLLPDGQERLPHKGGALFKGHSAGRSLKLGLDQISPFEEIEVTVREPGGTYGRRHHMMWQAPCVILRRCRPAAEWFPPIYQERLSALCDLYVASYTKARTWGPTLSIRVSADADPYTFEPSVEPCRKVGFADDDPLAAPVVGTVHVAAEEGDFERWQDAALEYLTEINDVVEQLSRVWCDDGKQISLSSWRTRRRFARWQSALADGYDRLLRASERYRPVHDEVRAQAEETARAFPRMGAQIARLFAWQRRKLWYLAPAEEDEFRIIRSDVVAPPEADQQPGGFGDVIEEAQDKRFHLHLVDWDEEAVRVSDRELAAIAEGLPPYAGTTPAGKPIAPQFPSSLLDLAEDWYGSTVKRLNDRDELERDREWRAEAERKRAQQPPRRTTRYYGGSGSDYGGFGIHT